MQNLEWYLADLKSTGKNTIETVEKSLTDMFIRLVRIYPCLSVLPRVTMRSKTLANGLPRERIKTQLECLYCGAFSTAPGRPRKG